MVIYSQRYICVHTPEQVWFGKPKCPPTHFLTLFVFLHVRKDQESGPHVSKLFFGKSFLIIIFSPYICTYELQHE